MEKTGIAISGLGALYEQHHPARHAGAALVRVEAMALRASRTARARARALRASRTARAMALRCTQAMVPLLTA